MNYLIPHTAHTLFYAYNYNKNFSTLIDWTTEAAANPSFTEFRLDLDVNKKIKVREDGQNYTDNGSGQYYFKYTGINKSTDLSKFILFSTPTTKLESLTKDNTYKWHVWGAETGWNNSKIIKSGILTIMEDIALLTYDEGYSDGTIAYSSGSSTCPKTNQTAYCLGYTQANYDLYATSLAQAQTWAAQAQADADATRASQAAAAQTAVNREAVTSANQTQTAGNGASCFTAGTKVIMGDGTLKNIENIKLGDMVIADDKKAHKVTRIGTPTTGGRKLYALNDGQFNVTPEHPFLTTDGWKSIDPDRTLLENPDLDVSKLEIGDTLITTYGQIKLTRLESISVPSIVKLYNLHLEGSVSYNVDNYIAHSVSLDKNQLTKWQRFKKWVTRSEYSDEMQASFLAGTKVELPDGTTTTIEKLQVGMEVSNTEGGANTVQQVRTHKIGETKMYSLNNKVTVADYHPFLTTTGWRSIDPEASFAFGYQFGIGKLKVGQEIMGFKGNVQVTNLNLIEVSSEEMIYDISLDGNHLYYAEELAGHNGWGDWLDPRPNKIIENIEKHIDDPKQSMIEQTILSGVAGAIPGAIEIGAIAEKNSVKDVVVGAVVITGADAGVVGVVTGAAGTVGGAAATVGTNEIINGVVGNDGC